MNTSGHPELKRSCGRCSCYCGWIEGKQPFCDRDPEEYLGFYGAQEAPEAKAVAVEAPEAKAAVEAPEAKSVAAEVHLAAAQPIVATPKSLKRTASVAFTDLEAPPAPKKASKRRRIKKTETVVPNLPLLNLTRSCTAFCCTCGGLEPGGGGCLRYGGTGAALVLKAKKD